MNIDDMKYGDIKKIAQIFNQQENEQTFNNEMIGEYVIVRCRDAGVHAGFLKSHKGRECILQEARRLWYWKPEDGAKFLSGVANQGLHKDSKISEPVEKIHLTENCEIISCTNKAMESISKMKASSNE
jgi:hypothetical protein